MTSLLRGVGAFFMSAMIPLIEFLWLRLYLKYVLQIKLGFPFGTDYDFVPFAILSVFLLLLFLRKNKSAPLTLQKVTVLIHGASFLAVLIVTFLFKSLVSYTHPIFMAFWFLLVSFTLVSSLFLWRSPSYYRLHPKRYLIWPALILSLSGVISRTVFDFLWEPIAHMTGIVTYSVLGALLPSLQYKLNFAQTPTRIDEYTLLSHPEFGIAIGRGCAGLEGIFLFLGVFAFFVVTDRTRFSLQKWCLLGSLGIIYMYLLNVVRLSLFFLGSLGAIRLWGTTGVHLANTLFHNSIGWIFYSLGLLLFFSVTLSRKLWGLLSTRKEPRLSVALGTRLRSASVG